MIAVPITARTLDAALKDAKIAEKAGADVVELRLDYLSDVDDDALRALLAATALPKIATVRRKADGGLFRGTEKERLDMLRKACELGADYVDAEIDVDASVFDGTGSRVICSYHNFNQTPSVDDLLAILRSCAQRKPAVVKIVTMANKYSDNVSILEFLEKAKKVAGRVKVVSFCMGDKGRLSRVLCTKFGSFMTFASLGKGRESAPGQVGIGLAKEFSEVFA